MLGELIFDSHIMTISKDMDFPIFKTKIGGVSQKFNLVNPQERKKYFELKAGGEIRRLREYLKENSFICYLLGKKNSGKGTYAKMFKEIIWPEKIDHLSIGDTVRSVDEELRDSEKRKKLIEFLKKNYRGRFSLDEIIYDLEHRDTKTLRPTELILVLVKREVAKRKEKALFIDGFPRNLDQISYTLFFRDLIDYREDPDIFVLIDVPEAVIDMRMRYRVVCPKCQTPRNLKLLRTKKIGYDKEKNEFYLICDSPNCSGARMVQKEGDELGIKAIEERLKIDEKLMKMALNLYGIPKVFLRNSIPVDIAKDYVDEYEITPEYIYQWMEKENEVKVIEKPLEIRDDKGVLSYSLLPEPVVVSLIKQLVKILLPYRVKRFK